MTQYSDIPQVNTLYTEQAQVRAAISLIDNSGTMTSFVISAPPSPPPDPTNPMPMNMQMPVGITVHGTVQASTMTAIRTELQARDDAITSELAGLGVTNAPAR